ncbi:MAG: type II toxin-antitoxin system death-on-curing family toxin [Thaumarchaeota archaeon]|nr:type II toxin-antitoxin system death-on-curing family toxin [Nitrososphaerota archaeon]
MPKKILYPDLSTLAKINKEVVSLTNELHEYNKDDEAKLTLILKAVRSEARKQKFKEAVTRKASLLLYRIASGQHFYEGNKRTALVACLAFLQMNGYTINIKDKTLVAVIDKTSVLNASLNDTYQILKKLIRNVKEQT